VFPGVYDFRWETGHLLFLGIFYAVVLLVVCTLSLAAWRSAKDLRQGRSETIRWEEDFHSLPAASRACRHRLTGEIGDRACPNGFDCRKCSVHKALLARRHASASALDRSDGEGMFGFRMPADRLYHRGHTWVRPEEDGTVTIGLDDLARRLVGRPDALTLPEVGAHLAAHGTAWRMRKEEAEVRVLCPIAGTLVERGGPDLGWYLRLRPDGGALDRTHLLCGGEVGSWILHEVDRLERLLAHGAVGIALSDGGLPVEDLSAVIRDRDREAVLGEIFLDP
jgi:hypothetical protein